MQKQSVPKVIAHYFHCYRVPQRGLEHFVEDSMERDQQVTSGSPKRNHPGRRRQRTRYVSSKRTV